MEHSQLIGLRQHFNENGILLCFNGPTSRSLIEEIGKALKNYLQAENAHPSAAMDVFSVYVEMTQNIRHYTQALNYDDVDGAATILVAKNDDGQYVVQAGNLVEKPDGDALIYRIDALAKMDKEQLKAAYKTQLRQPRDEHGSAGLGLIDMSRKSSVPLSASLTPFNECCCFFSLRATI
jgi:hypothetical protein